MIQIVGGPGTRSHSAIDDQNPMFLRFEAIHGASDALDCHSCASSVDHLFEGNITIRQFLSDGSLGKDLIFWIGDPENGRVLPHHNRSPILCVATPPTSELPNFGEDLVSRFVFRHHATRYLQITFQCKWQQTDRPGG